MSSTNSGSSSVRLIVTNSVGVVQNTGGMWLYDSCFKIVTSIVGASINMPLSVGAGVSMTLIVGGWVG